MVHPRQRHAGVQSGRGRNPTPSTWAPGTAQDARRHGERHVCIGILHGAGHLGINQATHPPPVRQFGRPAACAALQDPPGPLTAVAARGWRPYGGINPSLGCKFGVQATVPTGKSLTVGFRPLPDWTPAWTAARQDLQRPAIAMRRLRGWLGEQHNRHGPPVMVARALAYDAMWVRWYLGSSEGLFVRLR